MSFLSKRAPEKKKRAPEKKKIDIVLKHMKKASEKLEGYKSLYFFGTRLNSAFETIPKKMWSLPTELLCRLVIAVGKENNNAVSLERIWERFLSAYGETETGIEKGIIERGKRREEKEKKREEDQKKEDEENRKIGITPGMSCEQRYEIRHKIELDKDLAELKELPDEKLEDYAKILEGACERWGKTKQQSDAMLKDASTCSVLSACGARGARAQSNAADLMVDENSVMGLGENETLREYCERLTREESGLASDDWYFSLWLHTF